MMKTLYFQYDNKITDCRFVWVAELSVVADQPIVRPLLDLLDAYEYGTITSEEQDELDAIEARIARYGFYFADCIEDLPTTKYDVIDEGDSCD
jgi:hypothetical protein